MKPMMTQERAQEIAESIWGDIAFTQIKPRKQGEDSFQIGWRVGANSNTFYGDDWADACDVVRRCVSQPGWPDAPYPKPDEAARILQRLKLTGIE